MAWKISEFWEKVVDARQGLVAQYAADPNVTLIDIGHSPADCEAATQVVLRIHVTNEWCASSDKSTAVQAEVAGIPVCVICEDS